MARIPGSDVGFGFAAKAISNINDDKNGTKRQPGLPGQQLSTDRPLPSRGRTLVPTETRKSLDAARTNVARSSVERVSRSSEPSPRDRPPVSPCCCSRAVLHRGDCQCYPQDFRANQEADLRRRLQHSLVSIIRCPRLARRPFCQGLLLATHTSLARRDDPSELAVARGPPCVSSAICSLLSGRNGAHTRWAFPSGRCGLR
jgi:hypothetical protein